MGLALFDGLRPVATWPYKFIDAIDVRPEIPPPFHCLSTAFPPPSMPFHCHCLSTAFPLPFSVFSCFFTAFPSLFYCLSTAFPCFFTASPMNHASGRGRGEESLRGETRSEEKMGCSSRFLGRPTGASPKA